MTTKTDKLEETRDVTHASRGETAKPVDTGNPHAKRPADASRGDPEPAALKTKEVGPVDVGNPQANRKADKVTKSSMIKEMIALLSAMDTTELAERFAALSEGSEEPAVDNISQVVSEDLREVFGSAQLSEEVTNKALIIFEAAVSSKVSQRNAELEGEFEAKAATLEEEITERVTADLETTVDKYLSFVAEQWAEDNKVALESGIRAELSESLLTGLKSLFDEHYIHVPEDKVDVVESLTTSLTEAEEQLNKANEQLIEQKKEIISYQAKAIVEELSEGLTAPERDRFTSLVESVDKGNLDEFKTKATVIREGVVPPKAAPAASEKENTTLDEGSPVEVKKPTVKPYTSMFRD